MGNITSDKNGGALDSANLSRKKVAGMEVGLQVVLMPVYWPMEKSSKRLYKGVTELNRDGQKGEKKATAPPKSWASLFKKVEEEGKAFPEKSDITSDFSVSMLTEVDSSVQLENFCHATRIDLIHLIDNEMMFSMMGIDESIALEFWRILIEEYNSDLASCFLAVFL
ncbi:hypothetical protein TIFTF001_031179 [Ficus carica]|uniref:Uncharacterized protein n=1 Tax=Ficus carica TaxID=3494 RepID=A0AA88DUW0_FICCA|nr:hypothetical protein TIFTF001_031179 [Ficus carica]